MSLCRENTLDFKPITVPNIFLQHNDNLKTNFRKSIVKQTGGRRQSSWLTNISLPEHLKNVCGSQGKWWKIVELATEKIHLVAWKDCTYRPLINIWKNRKKSLIYSVNTHSSKLTWIKLRFQHHNLAYKRVKQGSLGPNALTQQRDLSIENNTIRVLAFGFEITDATFKSKIHFFVVLCIKLSVGQTTFPGQKK